MLSLQGSIQPDPFSPKHVAQMDKMRQAAEVETDVDEIEAELEDGEPEDDSDGSDVDTYKATHKKRKLEGSERGRSGRVIK